MERRIFISFFRLLPLGLLFGCNESHKKIAETNMYSIQDKMLEYFNQGKRITLEDIKEIINSAIKEISGWRD